MAHPEKPSLQRRILNQAAFLIAWLILAGLGVLLLFQVHVTLVAAGLALVRTPALRPTGWNTFTIHGLSRGLYLVLGIGWLFAVSFWGDNLREAVRLGRLRRYVVRAAAFMMAFYGICYVLLRLLS